MEIDLVAEGLKFMVIGMSVVFIFLVLMVVAINIQAKIVNRFFPEKAVEPKKPAAQPAGSDSQVIAAIMGAIQSYRNKHNQ
jgi:oxaloacetate decarboxylase gamma subunit